MRLFFSTCLYLLLFLHLAHAQKPELVVPIGHTSTVKAVTFSPNGRFGLSGSGDGTIKLWEISTGKLLHTFAGHKSTVSSVSFSPDGQYALSGSRDKTLKLWDISTGNLLRTFEGHTSSVEAVSFSPDGRYALSGSLGWTLELWDISTGRLVRTFSGHTNVVKAVSFSPDGRYALSGSSDSTAKLWDISTGQLVRTFEGPKNKVETVSFSPDGRSALSGSWDGTIKLWEISTGKLLHTFAGHKSTVSSVSFSPDGQYALSGSWDWTLKLWDISTGQLMRTFEGHIGPVEAVSFSPDGHYILSGNSRTLKSWEVSTGKLLRNFEGHTNNVKAVSFSPDEQHILSGSLGAILKLWEIRTGQLVYTFKQLDFDNAANFSPDGQFALSGGAHKTLKLWEVSTGKLLRIFEGHSGAVEAVSLSQDRRYALSGSLDSTAKLWDISTGQLVHSFVGHKNIVTAVSFSPDGRYASSGSADNTVKLWDINTGQLVHSFVGHKHVVEAVSFSPDGRYILSGSYDNTVKLWDINSGQLVHSFSGHTNIVYAVNFSPDGRYALSGSADKTAKLWDINTGQLVLTFEGHMGTVKGVSLSPDGYYLLSGSSDHTTKVWNVATGQEIATLIAVDSTDWVVTTPTGLFDASPGALKLMHYVVNDSTDHEEPWKVIELNQLKQRYYQPGLLPILMGYSKELLRQVPAFEDVSLPPSIQLSLQNELLTVSLQNRKGGIGRVSVFINGAEVVEELRPNPRQDSTKATLTLTLPLNRFASRFDTTNIISVVAFNRAGWLSSRPQEITFRPVANRRGVKVEATQTTALRDTRLRAVVVGTSNVGLHFAHKDAEQIANGLRLAASELLGKERVTIQTLTSQDKGPQQTTKAAIVSALEAGQQTRPQDMFVLYLSGHGVNYGGQEDGDFYYLTAGATSADAGYLNDPAIRQTYALSSEELTRYLNLIPARKKLLILDVCAAGRGAEKMLVAARDIPATQIRALDRLQSRTGFYVLAGSAADAVSYETSVYGQGLLTYALLKGMRGASLRREGSDEFVDVEQWLGYAVEQVPVLAKEIQGIQQPFYRGIGSKTEQRSFDIGRVTETVKARIHIADPKPVLIVRSFQEDTQFEDVLGLQNKVEGALINLSARGTDAPVLFMEAKDYPGAYTLNGRYRVEGESITVSCKVFRATVVTGEFVVKGEKNKLPDLAEQILAQAQQIVK